MGDWWKLTFRNEFNHLWAVLPFMRLAFTPRSRTEGTMYFSLLPLLGPQQGAAQTSSFQRIEWLVQAARTRALTAGSGVSFFAALSPMA